MLFLFSLFIGLLDSTFLSLIKPHGSFYGYLSKSSAFGLLSLMIYVLSYTPLKRMSTVSIFVGAIPGAIPVMLGWVAATNKFGLAVGILFAIQFLWQFPHFISISWIRDKEYKKAGFKMMYGDKKGVYPCLHCINLFHIYDSSFSFTLFFRPQDIRPINNLLFLSFSLGIWFTKNSFLLLRNLSDESAKKLMLSSFFIYHLCK